MSGLIREVREGHGRNGRPRMGRYVVHKVIEVQKGENEGGD